MSARGFGLAVIVLAACGPERDDEVVLREVCGQAGPVRVFEIDGDRAVPSIVSMEPVGEKLLWHVVHREPDSNAVERSYWITDRCGESARELEGVEAAGREPEVPDVVVAADRSEFPRDFLAIDPEGVRARQVIFKNVGMVLGEWRGGFVSVDDVEAEASTLSYRAYPTDPWSDPIPSAVTLTSVRGPFTGIATIPSLSRVEVRDDAIWAIDTADNLVRITGLTSAPIVELQDVYAFEISEDQRWLAWQDTTGAATDEVVREIRLRDRESGTEQPLWVGNLPIAFLSNIDDGVVYSPSGWVRFPSLDLVPRQSERMLVEHLDGSRWVTLHASDVWDDARGLSILDLDTGEESVLFLGETKVAETFDDGMEVVGWIDFSSPPSPEESNLLWVPYDGAPPTELARAVTAPYQRLDDGRVVTALGVDASMRGRLVLVDPDTLDEGVIDRDVYVYNRSTVPDPGIWGDDVVLYQVDDGDRSGMWVAALPEAR